MVLNKFMGAAVVRAVLLSLGLILWAVGPAQAFTLYAKTLTGDPVALEVQSSDTIASVKAQIETAKGFASARQRLIFAGQLLADANTLAFYNIQPGTTLHLVVTRGVPTVTAISPATGTVAGGTSVTITGTDTDSNALNNSAVVSLVIPGPPTPTTTAPPGTPAESTSSSPSTTSSSSPTTSTAGTASTGEAAASTGKGQLPTTGSDAQPTLLVALTLILVGGVLIRVARRRHLG
jgi:LPXTG-motif cell wall-anchored protein